MSDKISDGANTKNKSIIKNTDLQDSIIFSQNREIQVLKLQKDSLNIIISNSQKKNDSLQLKVNKIDNFVSEMYGITKSKQESDNFTWNKRHDFWYRIKNWDYISSFIAVGVSVVLWSVFMGAFQKAKALPDFYKKTFTKQNFDNAWNFGVSVVERLKKFKNK